MELVSYRRDPTGIPSTLHSVRTQQEGICYEPGRGLSPERDHAGILILGFPASGISRNKFMLFISHPVWDFVTEAHTD